MKLDRFKTFESKINEGSQPKNQREIKIMILALEKQREALPEFTAFGDNNWEKIDYQIDILKGVSEFSDADDVYDREDELGDATSEIAAAFEWMEGTVDNDSLVDDEYYEAAQKELDELNTKGGLAPTNKVSVCPKMCKECPFSKNAMPGWLADYTPQDIQNYMSHEAFFPCHMMMPEGVDDMNQQQVQDAIAAGEMKFCRGYVESMIKSGKMPYKNKALVEAYNKVKAEGVSPNTMNIFEFTKHHTRE